MEYILLVLLALAIAVPLAIIVMNQWLQNFAYRVSITPVYFIVAGVAALLLTIISVSFHAIRTALTNPADVLRYE